MQGELCFDVGLFGFDVGDDALEVVDFSKESSAKVLAFSVVTLFQVSMKLSKKDRGSFSLYNQLGTKKKLKGNTSD